MDNLFTLGITLSAIDQFSKPLANMANSVGIFGKKINNTKLNGISKEIEDIAKELESLGAKKSGLEKKFRKYSQEAYRFNKILRDTDKEIEKLNKEKLKLEKEFKKGTISAKKFNNSIEKIDRELNRLNSKRVKIDEEFRRANAQANILKRGISRVSEKINSLNSKKLELRGEFSKISKEIEQSKERLNSFALKLSSIGAIGVGVGRQVGGGLLGFVKDYKEVEKAQGDIASLGIDASGIEKITKTAKQMSNQFAGVTAPDFIKASYDIKSGIASLSSEGVAEFTKFATVTASATKSSVDEMTKLFALGYGIFKRANESDIDFGKRFSASIGKAVQAFRTDGSDLVQGISNIGATAKAMGVSLEQELAIIGKAKDAFSSAAEAGTAYRAFLAGAVNAQKELGVSFLDTKGKLLPMYMVLEQIKKKFGKTIDANEMAKLKKAFGSEEAVKIITALINKTKELKNAQKDLMSAEYSDTEAMAKARNKGKEFELLGQRLHNLAATFGKVLAPAVDWVSEKIGKFSMWLSKFAQKHKWVSWLVSAAAALSVLAVVLGTVGLAVGAVIGGFGMLSGAMGTIAAVGAVVFSPVALAIAGIIALVGVLIYKWEDLLSWFRGFWASLKQMFPDGVAFITSALSELVDIAKGVVIGVGVVLYAIIDMLSWIGDGIYSIISSIVGFIVNIWSSLGSWFGEFWAWLGEAFSAGANYLAKVFVGPISWIKKMWAKLLNWLGKKINAIKQMVNKLANFVGFGNVFDVNINSSGGGDVGSGGGYKSPKIVNSLGNIPKLTKVSPDLKIGLKDVGVIKDIAKNTSKIKDIKIPEPKIAKYLPKNIKKKSKSSGAKKRKSHLVKSKKSKATHNSFKSSNMYSGSVGSSRGGGNEYNINITVNGTPNEISSKLSSMLPGLIKDLEENLMGRAMYDL